MSEEAKVVLNKMRAGCRLFGSGSDYGRPFRLQSERTRDDVNVLIAKELIDSDAIRAVDCGDGQTEWLVRG
jgi:hypothetical protein